MIYYVTSTMSPPARIRAINRSAAIKQYIELKRGYLSKSNYRKNNRISARIDPQQL